MEERKSRDRVRTRREIFAAAEHLFANRGYDATSMRDLAEAAGVRAPTLYHYFPSKQALLEALFEDFYSQLADLYDGVEKSLPRGIELKRALITFMRAHREFIEERPNFSSIFLFEGMREESPAREILPAVTAGNAAVMRRLADRWPKLNRAHVVSLFLGVVGLNIFFQKTEGYVEMIAGEALAPNERAEAIESLIGKE
ncbi:MAG: TetR/AcrR family transcriptional regulator [Planctomycetota bacterium]